MFASPYTFCFAWATAAFLAFSASCTLPPTSNTLTYQDVAMDDATGTLFIIGGGSRPLSLMDGVVNRMASKDDLVVVLPMASSEPEESLVYGIRPFEELGCTNVHGMNLHPGNWGEAQLDSIRNAKAFYLCGGDQARFMAVAQGEIAEAIREAFRRGAVISGSSAGAAMMSEVMITGDQLREPEYESTYRRLMTENGIYLNGLGLLDGAIIDQHFVERSRYNRALSALHDHPGLPVFGIGESTALVIEPMGLSVEGEGQVVVFQPGTSRTDTTGLIALSDVRIDVYFEGDRISGSQP
ncbi:cyanophycinase [bacterium]|jgi:cyanophycinase|nr:cyanophycinase [bacterium]